MPQSRLTITGTEAVAKAFKELVPKIARGVVRASVKKASQEISDAIKARDPVRTGKLRRKARVRTSKGPRGSGSQTVASAALSGEATRGKGQKASTWYAFLIERGWTSGKRQRKGAKVTGYLPHSGNLGAKGVRKIAGKFIVKKVLKAKEEPVKQRVIVEILKGIEAEAAKG